MRSGSKVSLAGAHEFWEGLSDKAYLSKLALGDINTQNPHIRVPIFSVLAYLVLT